MKKILFTATILLVSNVMIAQSEVTQEELREHIEFLSSDKNAGRFPGTKANKRVVKYIIKSFKKAGIEAYGKSYKQEFQAKIRVKKGEAPKPEATTWNVIGYIEGNDPVLKDEFIILGAHYDHLGMGGPSSKSDHEGIHNGADDNASGTAALLEIGERIAANKHLLKRSVLLLAFGAEEQGLLGSKNFTENPVVPLSQVKLMVNMDMVGRLNNENHVYMGGAGTFPGGVELMKNLGEPLGLTVFAHPGSIGGSDHVSFYKKDISVMGIHTGGHPQYHTTEDTVDLINFPGQEKVCNYIYSALMKVATTDYKMEFIRQD
ncbi:Peptidase family M28 [Zhouia amylolytica]|uniref:Peptidase family M28 n=1 Tax=Zhouia amylolytica TaxID=376730 RepID=A0A1I6S7T7_9FLAO|nr:M20/M25/M40 family metallo-hydrolase [Zhouia amylolytica]SFS72996.1 Peptidase family M28 [Zhouia amylolytica]